MRSVRLCRHYWACIAIVVVVCLSCGGGSVDLVKQHIIVDIEGTVEDFAALSTIIQDPVMSKQLRMITIGGGHWGYAASTLNLLCGFARLTQTPKFIIDIGVMVSSVDAHNPLWSHGSCGISQGFPSTPRDAAARGMPYSKADVATAFQASYSLPLNISDGSCAVAHDMPASFVHLLNDIPEGERLTYIMLSSATSLAGLFSTLKTQGDLSRVLDMMDVHIFEKGYTASVDPSAMQRVLSSGATVYLYTPQLYDTAPLFTRQHWDQLQAIEEEESTVSVVRWWIQAWRKKKEHMTRTFPDERVYYSEYAPASSMVALCTTHTAMRDMCQAYCAPVSRVTFTNAYPTLTDLQELLPTTGNNVTAPGYYVIDLDAEEGIQGRSQAPSASPEIIVCANPASLPLDNTSLVAEFWKLWLTMLREH